MQRQHVGGRFDHRLLEPGQQVFASIGVVVGQVILDRNGFARRLSDGFDQPAERILVACLRSGQVPPARVLVLGATLLGLGGHAARAIGPGAALLAAQIKPTTLASSAAETTLR